MRLYHRRSPPPLYQAASVLSRGWMLNLGKVHFGLIVECIRQCVEVIIGQISNPYLPPGLGAPGNVYGASPWSGLLDSQPCGESCRKMSASVTTSCRAAGEAYISYVLPHGLRWVAEFRFFGVKEAHHVLAVQRQEEAFRACWPELARPCLHRAEMKHGVALVVRPAPPEALSMHCPTC